jgi:AraC-like DNA-binding protein
MPKRKINYLEVTVCLDGDMTYYIDDERVELSRGDALIIAPGSHRTRYRSANNVYYASFNIVTPPDWIPKKHGVIRGCVDISIAYLLELFNNEWSGPRTQNRLKCNALFTYIYYKIEDSITANENKHISAAKKYISKNLFTSLSLSEIASEISITPQHLSTLFKKHTGKTVVDYINDEKINVAKSKILTSRASLCEIAESCGFSSYNYFTSLFKKCEGISPSEYRRKFSKQLP